MEQDKYITKDRLKVAMDSLQSMEEKKQLLSKLKDGGYTIEGYNDQPKQKEPNLAQSLASGFIGGASNIANTAETYGRAGFKTLTGDKSFAQNVEEQRKAVEAEKQIGSQILFGEDAKTRDLSTAKGWERLGGDVLSTATAVVPAGASLKGASTLAKIGQAAKIGAGTGAAFGAGTAMQEGGSVGDVLKSSAENAVIGAGLGASLPALFATPSLVKSLPKLSSESTTLAKQISEKGLNMVKEGIKPTPTVEMAIRQVTQDKNAEIMDSFKNAYKAAKIDPAKINTYKDLYDVLKNTVSHLAGKVDSTLDDTVAIPLSKLGITKTTQSGTSITSNFVEKSLGQLDELYTKTGDDLSKANITDLINKANNQGLTLKEINDLSRKYNSEFGSKAFSKVTGEPLTSINAQMYENTRMGLKDTARQGMSGDVVKALDKDMSDIYRVLDYIETVQTKVQDLQNKVEERGWLAKGAYMGVKAFNTLTGGMVRGAMDAALNRGTGLKTLNALDLEKNLQRNLKIIDKALKSESEQEVANTLRNAVTNYGRQVKIAKTGTEIVKLSKSLPNATTKVVKEASKLSTTEKLTQEAKKYKSAEEFVKAQPKLYHGGSADIKDIQLGKSNFQKTFYMSENPDYAKSFGGNKSSLNEIMVDSKAKLADLRKPSDDLVKQIEDIISSKPTGKTVRIQKPDGTFLEIPETKGGLSNPVHSSKDILNGIRQGKAYFAEMPEVKNALKKLGYDGMITQESKMGTNFGVWNKDILKTKSQLEQIWKEANK